MNKFIVCFFLCLFSTQSCFSYLLSTGTHVPYFKKAQVDNSGATQTFALNPYFGAGLQYNISSSQFFSPEIGYVYYRDEDAKVRTELIMFQYNFSYILNSQFLLRYGLSTNWMRIIGEGGSVTLNNGNSTQSFPAPDKTVSTYYSTLNIGTEYLFKNRIYGLRFDLNIMSFSKLENRAYNYLLTFNFYR